MYGPVQKYVPHTNEPRTNQTVINSENSECITQEVITFIVKLSNCFTVSTRRIYELLHVVGCTCNMYSNNVLVDCNCSAIKTPSRYFSSV
jgi:hypothetical protein